MTPRTAVKLSTRMVGRHQESDSGQTLIVVLVVALIILSLTGVALTYTVTNLSDAGTFANGVQSRLAAETAINVALSQIGDATSSGSLPCSMTSSVALPGVSTSTYQYSITYYGAAPPTTTPTVSCTAGSGTSTLPNWAAITATGTQTNTSPVKLVEDLSLSQNTVTTPSPAFANAILSTSVTIANKQDITQSTSAPANVTALDGFNCPNHSTIDGSVYSYTTSATLPSPPNPPLTPSVSLGSACTINGGLYANSSLNLSSATVSGALESFGTGGITLSQGFSVGGNAFATQGGITLNQSSSITGNASATGSITCSKVAKVCNQNDAALSGQTISPPAPTFPILQDQSGDICCTINGANAANNQAYWNNTEYKADFIDESGLTPTGNGVGSCNAYLGSSTFTNAVQNATVPTIIYAPECSFTDSGNTYNLKADIALVLGNFATSQPTTFQSSTSTPHSLSIIVPSSSGTINLANQTTFNDTTNPVNILMYTLGTYTEGQKVTMMGQVLANTLYSGGQNLSLVFSTVASQTIAGTSITTATGNVLTTEIRRYSSR